MNETIRAATPGDAEAIAACKVEAWRAAYRGLMPAELLDGLDPRALAETWRARLASPAARQEIWLLELDGEGCGFCSVGPVRDDDLDSGVVGEVQGINLEPSHWGRGLGRKLLLHAFGVLRRLSFEEVSLWCMEGNRRAERFYGAAGLHAEGPAVSKLVGGHELPHVRWRRPLAELARETQTSPEA